MKRERKGFHMAKKEMEKLVIQARGKRSYLPTVSRDEIKRIHVEKCFKRVESGDK